MSERIEHWAEAGNCINYARATESSAEAHLSMMQAQVHATLALVEQQRIANVFTLQSGAVNATRDAADDLVYARREDGDPVIRPELREALGL